MKPGGLKGLTETHRSTLVGLLLAAATCIAYGRVWHAQFTNYDDPAIVYENAIVVGGMTLPGLCWALTSFSPEYWHPLTWLSHMLDCQLFGLRPGWHHRMSLGFHVANTLLLFGVLRRMTGAWKRSAMVAALFALHPLHVESVAWIAERKDVLSGLFMLTLWAYARYAQKTVLSEQRSSGDHRSLITDYRLLITDHRSLLYLLSLLFFALGLMCKPMLMTLPFVLLLLDFWPLDRMGNAECGGRSADSRFTSPATRHPPLHLLWEKAPFFALTAVSCVLAFAWARGTHNILTTSREAWGLRLANVPISYARYLGKMIWPTDLIMPYPMPKHWAWWQAAGALLLVVVVTVIAVRRVRSAPYLIVGWLIFLGVLFPTIRVMHGGFQSIADRYTYLPSIGIFIAVVWAAADWSGRRHWGRTATVPGIAAGVLLLFGYGTWSQAGVWRNNVTLWTHCLAVCPDNQVAHYNLGSEFVEQGRLDEAVTQYHAAMGLAPAQAYNGLGKTRALQGKLDEAFPLFVKACAVDPELEEAHYNLGNAYLIKGRRAEAVVELKAALRLKPFNLLAQARLAEALIKLGRAGEALPYCEAVVRAQPQDAHARFALGEACLTERRLEQAVGNLKEAVRLAPDVPECLNALAWVYATCPKAELRNGPEAARLAERACLITKRQKAPPLDTLAATYAEAGRFGEAVRTAEEAIALTLASKETAAADKMRQRLELYRAGKPYRDE